MTAQPNSPEVSKRLAAKCLRIAQHFVDIAGELRELEEVGELSADSLATLRGSEQSQSVDEANSGLRRKRMIGSKRDEEFMGISAIVALLDLDVRAFRRLRRDSSANFPAPHQFGSSQRWKASEVRGWIERQRLKS